MNDMTEGKSYVGSLLEEELRDPEFARTWEQTKPYRRLAEVLISLRKRKNLSQSELGERIGCRQPAIARIENAASATLPRADTIQRYAEGCGLQAAVVFFDPESNEITAAAALGGGQSSEVWAARLSGRPFSAAEGKPRPGKLHRFAAKSAAAPKPRSLGQAGAKG